jgi:hypothetical protein
MLNVTGVTTLSFGPLAMLDVAEVTCHLTTTLTGAWEDVFTTASRKYGMLASRRLYGLSFQPERAIETRSANKLALNRRSLLLGSATERAGRLAAYRRSADNQNSLRNSSYH